MTGNRKPRTENGTREPSRITPLAWIYAAEGRSDDARRLARGIEQVARLRPDVMAFSAAIAQNAVGKDGEALSWLEQAYRQHDGSLIVFHAEPYFDNLKPHPRYQAVLARVRQIR